jgi:ribosomal protein S20
MPVIKSAKKRLAVSTRKRTVNLRTKRAVSSALKDFTAKPTQKSLDKIYSTLDSAAKKGVIPKGRADRKKGRLAIIFSKNTRSKRSQTKTTTTKQRSKGTKSSSQK